MIRSFLWDNTTLPSFVAIGIVVVEMCFQFLMVSIIGHIDSKSPTPQFRLL